MKKTFLFIAIFNIVLFPVNNNSYGQTGCSITPLSPHVCVGSTIVLNSGESSSGSDIWTANNSNATVTSTSTDMAGNSIATITGNSEGTVTIKYNDAVGGAPCTILLTVDGQTHAIMGPTTICDGSILTLTDATPGGTWSTNSSGWPQTSSSGGSGGTASLTGTGPAGGTTDLTYSSSNPGCGPSHQTITITDLALPTPGTITSANICIGTPMTLSVTGTVGIPVGWSVSSGTGTASIGASSGIITGLTPGTITVTYTVMNPVTNCTAATNLSMTVYTPPSAGYISGPTSVCGASSGNIITLISSVSGTGTWSITSNPYLAIHVVSGNYQLTTNGTVPGSTTVLTVSYSVTGAGGCTSMATYPVSVNTNPHAGSISGPSTVCPGATITLTAAGGDPGGSWSSAGPAIATVDAATGVVTGVMEGPDYITYSVSNSCGGPAVAGYAISVLHAPNAGTIAGAPAFCLSFTSTLMLTDATGDAGGTWSSSNVSIADVTTGLVTGYHMGTVNIYYSVTNSCGTATSSAFPLSVDAPFTPNLGILTELCTTGTGTGGGTAVGAPAGGTFSSSITSAITIGSTSGVYSYVTGVSLPASSTITYGVINSCGLNVVSTVVTLTSTGPTSAPAISLSPTSAVCAGNTITANVPSTTYTEEWSSSDNAIATVSGAGIATANITGVAEGTATIYYTISNACYSFTSSIPVPVDVPPTINCVLPNYAFGCYPMCTTNNTTLSGDPAGGIWTASSAGDATGGYVTFFTGMSGALTVSYSTVNSCGSLSNSICIMGVTNTLPTIAGPTTAYASPPFINLFTGTPAPGSWETMTFDLSPMTGPFSLDNSCGGCSINVDNLIPSGPTGVSTDVYYSIHNACGTQQSLVPVSVTY